MDLKMPLAVNRNGCVTPFSCRIIFGLGTKQQTAYCKCKGNFKGWPDRVGQDRESWILELDFFSLYLILKLKEV